jgi:hypothetical protein
MDEGEYWLRFWKMASITLIFVVTIAATSCQITNYNIRKMVEAGANPYEAKCAVADSVESTCAVYSLRKQ